MPSPLCYLYAIIRWVLGTRQPEAAISTMKENDLPNMSELEINLFYIIWTDGYSFQCTHNNHVNYKNQQSIIRSVLHLDSTLGRYPQDE